MDLEFAGVLWHWRGPSPFHFVSVPADECAAIDAVAPAISYGWGMVPVTVRVGGTSWTTSLWPKDGGYVVPVKTRVRGAEGLELGMTIRVLLAIDA